jgi:hypothetical protein
MHADALRDGSAILVSGPAAVQAAQQDLSHAFKAKPVLLLLLLLLLLLPLSG